MPKRIPFTAEELKFFRELQKRKVPFIVVGLSAAVLQGAPVSTQDVDLWFKDISDPRFQKALKAAGGKYIPPIGLHPPLIGGKKLELIDLVLTVHGLKKFDEEYKQCKKIRIGSLWIRVLPLERVLKSKEYLNRPKDRAVLPVLRDVLKTLKNR